MPIKLKHFCVDVELNLWITEIKTFGSGQTSWLNVFHAEAKGKTIAWDKEAD